jgi:hypothetical protein
MAPQEIARVSPAATSLPPDSPPWLAASVAQAAGLAIIGVVCLTAQLAVRAEELAAQAAELIASATEEA